MADFAKITGMDKEKLQNLRHSLAHLLAAAVLEIWPHAKRTIGPAVENGFYYDFDFSTEKHQSGPKNEDLHLIEEKMREMINGWDKFEKEDISVKDAKKMFSDNPYKLELIEEYGDQGLSIVKSGEFIDLCRGGHIESARDIKPNAFKLTHIAGAYWRGSEKNKMLTRIYGVAFETKKELDEYLWQQEEAKKRDHRKLGQELDLFFFSDLVGPGLPLWTVKGTVIRDELEKFAKETEAKWGYQRVATPHIAKSQLFETSGHLPYYKDDMYPGMELDDATYYLKAMNCPMTMALFSQKPHSYRELPLRLAEYGTVYRYERSGVLSGLLRVRGFTQNDAHIFCTEDQLENEFVQVMKLHEYYYRDVFGIKDYYVRLSLRDKSKKDKFGGNDEIWDKAESVIQSAIKKSGIPFQEAIGEASFYGPKADFQIKSVIDREETASTNQIDFIMPARFGLKYTGANGKEHPIVVIHRAPLGSHERFIGFLIEHYAGAFPLWLSPVQVAVANITDEQLGYAGEIVEKLRAEGIRVEWYNQNETIGKKIREAELQKVPYIAVIGEKETKAVSVAVRQRGEGDKGAMKLEKFIEKIKKEIKVKN
ncbi:MAG: threonine--tRNA ligase [Candidatus Yanofskybacteria bacterium]|nr:threonine--tRNA ligase [Candidatus Yanofskybacteria bacterium]